MHEINWLFCIVVHLCHFKLGYIVICSTHRLAVPWSIIHPTMLYHTTCIREADLLPHRNLEWYKHICDNVAKGIYKLVELWSMQQTKGSCAFGAIKFQDFFRDYFMTFRWIFHNKTSEKLIAEKCWNSQRLLLNCSLTNSDKISSWL